MHSVTYHPNIFSERVSQTLRLALSARRQAQRAGLDSAAIERQVVKTYRETGSYRTAKTLLFAIRAGGLGLSGAA